jgi:ribosome-associated protein
MMHIPHADPEPEEDSGPSKSQRKRDMIALQRLGERLVEVPPSTLASLELPEILLDAIALARRITAHEGRRRQMQYIGRLMRRVDADAVRARLALDDAHHHTGVAVMHAAERWRDALLVQPDRLAEFVARYPGTAALALHPMVRAAAAEAARQQRGRHYRELFRALRDILAAHTDDGSDAALPTPPPPADA